MCSRAILIGREACSFSQKNTCRVYWDQNQHCNMVLGDISPGAYSGEATPVPISNTVVKVSSADGTIPEPVWESRTVPGDFFI